MNRWLTRVGALLLGLVLGVGSSVLYNVYNVRRTITLCEIDDDTAKYAGHSILLHAYISIDNGQVNVFSVCGNVPVASVDFEPNQLEDFRAGIHTRAEETGYFVYEVILAGTVDPPDGMPHRFSAKFHISNARIERTLSSEEFPSSRELADWFNSKSR